MSTEAKDKKTKERRTIKRTRTSDHISLYANNVQVEISLFELKLSFGEVKEIDERGLTFEEKLTVILSPQHAKVFAGTFLKNVATYEKQFGTINIPKEFGGAFNFDPAGKEVESEKEAE